MNSMSCPACRSILLHRAKPAPEASRCSSLECDATYDVDGDITTTDPGPWPDDIAATVRDGTGSCFDSDSGAQWYWQIGTSTTI